MKKNLHTKKPANLVKQELEAVLDYCQSDREWESFRDYLIENGSPVLSEDELDILATTNNDNAVQELLEKAAECPGETHIWAVAYRVRKAFGL